MIDTAQSVHILLVEDSATDAELTLRALQKSHLANHLVWVKDGAEALDFIYGTGAYADSPGFNTPKVILLDLKLPKISGLEVLRRLKSDERTRTIPIVVLTSSKENPDVEASYRLGVNSFVTKPVEFEAFFKTIAELGMYWLLVNRVPGEKAA